VKWAVALLLLLSGAVFAQTGAHLDIRLLSDRGELIRNATLTLWPSGRQASATNGSASFDELPAGHYQVDVQAADFASSDTALDLATSEQRILHIHLHTLMTTLREVVITENQLDAPQYIYSRSEIRSTPARSIVEFLSQTAGLEVQSDGSPAANQTLRIGGSNPNQVLVLVDGRKLQNTGSGEADLSAIPLEWVESISVHRGSATGLAGEAIGGIVDISTRAAVKQSELSAEGEMYPTYGRASFLRAGQIGPLSSLISFVRTQGPGDFAYRISEDDGVGASTVALGDTYKRQNNEVLRDQWLGKVTSSIGSQGTLEISGAADRLSRGMPGYLAPQLTPNARQSSRQEVLNGRLFLRRDASALNARISYDHAARAYRDNDPFSLVRASDESSTREEISLKGESTIHRVLVNAGTDAEREVLRSAALTSGEAERSRLALWTTALFPLWESARNDIDISMQPGLRGERFGESGVLLPKLDGEIIYHSSLRAGMHLSVGNSYHAPTLYSLFWMDDEVARGNPDLKPEQSTEFVGRAYAETAAKNNLRAEVNVSVQRVRDLIIWQRTFDNRWVPYNLRRANVRTLDVNLDQSFLNDVITVSAGANWTEARDATDNRNTGDKYLAFRAPRSQRIQLSCHLRGLTLQSTVRWVSARPVLATNSKWLTAYHLEDMAASYSFRFQRVNIELSLGINNMTNENYRIVRFAPMPLSEWRFGIRIAEL
jgi:vitamin B12 transporter